MQDQLLITKRDTAGVVLMSKNSVFFTNINTCMQ
jgi:hypothetical protein